MIAPESPSADLPNSDPAEQDRLAADFITRNRDALEASIAAARAEYAETGASELDMADVIARGLARHGG